jgi:hypothetical protein
MQRSENPVDVVVLDYLSALTVRQLLLRFDGCQEHCGRLSTDPFL